MNKDNQVSEIGKKSIKNLNPIFPCDCCDEDQVGHCWTPENYVICFSCYEKFFEPLECDRRILLLNHLSRKNRMIRFLDARIYNDNRIENLELWSRHQPIGSRVEDKIKWCKEFLKKHGESC